MSKTVALADLLPGKGGRGIKTGLPRLVDTKLSGKAIVTKVLTNKSNTAVIDMEDVVKVGRAKLDAHAEATGVKVVATDEEIAKLTKSNFTTAARVYANRKGQRLAIRTEVTKSGKTRVIVALADAE